MEVLPHLAWRLDHRLAVECVPLGSKPLLLQGCGGWAATLLGGGCQRVLVIWDLFPSWRERDKKPCRREDLVAAIESIRAEKVDAASASLVCIREELEAWLIADGRALSYVLSTTAHPVKTRDGRNPESIRNPKKALNRLFLQHRGRPYVDRDHALQIVRALPDLSRLEKIPSFRRFKRKLLAT